MIGIILSLILIVLLVYALLWLPPVQQKIKDLALQEVRKITGNNISIGKIEFRPFNSLVLQEVYIEDQKNDTLLYARSIEAGFDLWKLKNNYLLINRIDLNELFLNVYKENPDTTFNFQFLIDAFASTDTTKQSEPSALQIEIEQVSLKNGRINYAIRSEPVLEDGVFDFNHIALDKLTTEIRLSSIDPENLDISLKQFSLEEKNGFILSGLKLDLRSKNATIDLDHFQLDLPQSRVEGKATIDHSGMELSDLLSGAAYNIDLSCDKFSLPDLHSLYPGLEGFADILAFSGKLEGKFPQVGLPDFRLNYGKNLQVQTNGNLADVNHWETSPFSFRMDRFYITNSLVSQILRFTSGEKSEAKLPVHIDAITLQAEIAGSLPDFDVRAQADMDEGFCALNANAGMLENGAVHFDGKLDVSNLNVGKLMLDTVFGIADLNIEAKGEISETGVIDASGSAIVNHFDFNSYPYRNILASGFYQGDSVQAHILSEDPMLPVDLQFHANTSLKHPSAGLYAKLSDIRLDSLNLLPDYPESEISMIVRADIRGFDPELMEANLSIDSLFVQTQTGSFDDNGLRARYSAKENSRKELSIRSKVLNVNSRGQFSFAGVERAVKQAFPVLFPDLKTDLKQSPPDDSFQENFNLVFQVRRSNALLPLLGIEQEIPDSALLIVRYNTLGSQLNLDGTAFCIFNETDTLKLSLDLSNIENNLDLLLQVDNKSQQYDVNGKMNAEVEFIPIKGVSLPDMNIRLKPTSVKINETNFNIRPAQISISDKRYEIEHFAFEHSPTEYFRIDGVVSEETSDSLMLDINNFQISTLLKAMKMDLPLSGIASGRIQASGLLNTPSIITRKFAVDSIQFDGSSIGNLSLMSGWSSSRQGLALRASLSGEDIPESVIQGFYLPALDSLTLSGNLKGLKLAWGQNYMKESLYGMGGSLGANFKVSGSLSDLQMNGQIYFDQARLGVKMLNTMYQVSDSIQISPNSLSFRRFTIRDENNKTATLNGQITHKRFADINPNLRISLDNFSVLNNENHTDSLFFGDLNVSGTLSLQKQNKEWVLGGNLTHGKNNTVMINIPTTPLEAQRYSSVTFVNSEGEELVKPEKETPDIEFSLPLKVSNLSISANPDLTLGAIYNPATGDKAVVSGVGSMTFSYDMNSAAMNLLGNYKVADGSLTISLPNITRKSFKMQENSELTFRGNPLKTGFDITAIYALRADMLTLDPSFGDIGMANTKINVHCLLTISGDLDNMKLGYNVDLPNQSDDVKQKMEGLLYTDDIKIKQIAYLLALGSFMPPGNNIGGSGNIWTSLVSSSITGQLNNLLSGVLSENWTIGTDIHTNDANFSQVEMDVNVSTHLLNNRLTINTSLGYNNDVTQRQNFTSDFDFEYKLTPNGNFLFRFYNITNNSYQDKAPMVQGVGLLYRREGKTFDQLFRSFKINREAIRFNRQRERVRETSEEKENQEKQGELKNPEEKNEN